MLKEVFKEIDESLLKREVFNVYCYDKYLNRTTFLKKVKNNNELKELDSLIEEYQNNVNSSYYRISYDDEFIVFDYGSSIKFLVIKRKGD